MTDNNKNIEIIPLPKEQWKGTPIPLVTKTDSYYDLEISPLDKDGCKINLIKKPFEKEVVHSPEEYDFPDGLYQDHWENAEAYGVVSDDGKMLACILGKRLMDKAKEVAVAQGRRAIILETQSCNTNAIGFYLHQGFELIGFDTCCYTNNDIGRQEVRINLGYFFHREAKRR